MHLVRRLEFVLSREMVCTGLSLFDFRQAVAEHTMESLLDMYAVQHNAVPLQLMPASAAPIEQQPGHRYLTLPCFCHTLSRILVVAFWSISGLWRAPVLHEPQC